MNLRNLTDETLILKTKRAAQDERESTTILLHHLIEVDRRYLFSKFSASSLYEYCVKELKMSATQASYRVNAARLLRDFPELEAKLNSGELCITNMSQAFRFFKKEAKEGEAFSREEKTEILRKIENTSTRDTTEKILLAHASNPSPIPKEKTRRLTEEHTEVRFVMDEELKCDLEHLKAIWARELSGKDFLALQKRMVKLCLEKVDPVRRAERWRKRKEKLAKGSAAKGEAPKRDGAKAGEASGGEAEEGIAKENSALARKWKKAKRSRFISAQVEHPVWLRDKGACTEEVEGKICGSTYFLELDHMRPFAMGGENTVGNLTLRCRTHNLRRALDTYGGEKMGQYLNPHSK